MSEDMKKTPEARPRKRPEPKISEENAAEQFEIFKEYFEVFENDTTSIAQKCDQVKDEVLKAVRMGVIEFLRDDETLVRHHLRKSTGAPDGPLDWKPEKLGVAKHAIPVMNGQQMANEYRKHHAMIAAMTGIDTGLVKKLHPLDQSIAEVISSLFLSS